MSGQHKSEQDNVAALDSIFARHGNPAVLITDNGAPFNGGHDHILQKYLRQEGIRHKPTESADDPEVNGLAEAFMKHCKKVWHTAIIGNKDPKMQLQKHLKMYRASPHPTTGKSPGSSEPSYLTSGPTQKQGQQVQCQTP